MIHHSVIFSLKLVESDPQHKHFWQAARNLAAIPGVQNFQYLKQISSKNSFEYGLSMEFADQQTYDNYSTHPAHETFIQDYWISYVSDFLEIDYNQLGEDI